MAEVTKMVWLIIAAVCAAVFMVMLYACLVAGARADREMERLLGQNDKGTKISP